MKGQQKGTEKKRKPTPQSETGVHGQEDESRFGLSSFIQYGKYAVKAKTAFGVSVPALDGISFTGIFVHLPFDFDVSFGGLSAAQRQAGQADATFRTKEFIGAGLIDFVRQHRAGIEAKFAFVILHCSLEVAALIEAAPTGLLQKGVTIYHRKVQFLPKFCGVGTFPTLDWSDMGLFQANDPILAGMGVVIVHFFLLAVNHRDYGKTVSEPAGKQFLVIRNHGRVFLQLAGRQLDVTQLLADHLAAFCLGPFLAFGQLQIGFPGLLYGIRQFVAVMRHALPEFVHRRLQMLPALVEQVDVRRILDVCGSHRGVQKQFSPILFPACLFLPGCVPVRFPFLFGRFAPAFPIPAQWGRRLVPMICVIVPIHVPLLLGPLPGTDIFVDLRHFFHRKPLAKMHHHGRVEQRLGMKLVQSHKVLHIAVFLKFLHCALVGQMAICIDEKRTECNPRGDGQTARFLAHVFYIHLFDVFPWHDGR